MRSVVSFTCQDDVGRVWLSRQWYIRGLCGADLNTHVIGCTNKDVCDCTHHGIRLNVRHKASIKMPSQLSFLVQLLLLYGLMVFL